MNNMIHITSDIALDEKELKFEFIQASGPGGQNVNKVATAVQLRFDALNSASLPAEVRDRLKILAGRRITDDGILIINARRFRTQARNRQDAVERLIELIRQALIKPKKRIKTKQSQASKKRILEAKRKRSKVKKWRQAVHRTDES